MQNIIDNFKYENRFLLVNIDLKIYKYSTSKVFEFIFTKSAIKIPNIEFFYLKKISFNFNKLIVQIYFEYFASIFHISIANPLSNTFHRHSDTKYE